jgi:hypothetical protein
VVMLGLRWRQQVHPRPVHPHEHHLQRQDTQRQVRPQEAPAEHPAEHSPNEQRRVEPPQRDGLHLEVGPGEVPLAELALLLLDVALGL